jgi:lipoprotein-anchoring transpeptidase ErfK/SrfK
MARRIEIDKSENRLRLYEDSKLLKEYPVATGRSTALTPEGTFRVVFKTWNPSWTNPRTGQLVPGGSPRNPLGSRWIGFDAGDGQGRSYGIHGTNDPSSIGRHISLGCVRMHNRDVQELYQLVPIGTRVTIKP